MKSLMMVAVFLLMFASPAMACTDGDVRPCESRAGICSDGMHECVNGEWAPCTVQPQEFEVCGNGLDDNCNGLTDECVSSLGPILIVLGACVFGALLLVSRM